MCALVLGCAWGTASTGKADDWNDVLKRYATPSGFNYDALAKDKATRAKLDAYVASLANMNKDAPLADWLNAYNALVVHSVIRRHPLKRVTDVPGFFKKEQHRVARASRTLDDIEHKIIRPRFKDPRVHVALNCAARSCPTLHGCAFRTRDLDKTLDRLAAATVANDTHVRVDGKRASVSEIFHWFEEDFKAAEGSVLKWLKKYDSKHRLRGVDPSAPLGRISYDWTLNQLR